MLDVRRKGLDHDWTMLRLFQGSLVQEVRRHSACAESNLDPDVRHVVTAGQSGLIKTATRRLGLDPAEHDIRGNFHLSASWVVLYYGESGRSQMYLVHDVASLVNFVLLVHEGFVDAVGANGLQVSTHHGLTSTLVQDPSSVETKGRRHVHVALLSSAGEVSSGQGR